MSAISQTVEEIDAQMEKIRLKIRGASAEGDMLVTNNWVGASMTLEALEKHIDHATAAALGADKSIRKLRMLS